MPRHITVHEAPTLETALAEAEWQLQAARDDKVREAISAYAAIKQAIALERIADALQKDN